jgi:hypothetical protein
MSRKTGPDRERLILFAQERRAPARPAGDAGGDRVHGLDRDVRAGRGRLA